MLISKQMEGKRPSRVLLGAGLQLLFLTATFISLTRSAWLYYVFCMLGVLLTSFFRSRRYRRILLAFLVGLTLIGSLLIMFSPSVYVEGISQLVDTRVMSLLVPTNPQNTVSTRLRVTSSALTTLFPYKWLVGEGLGGKSVEIVPVWYLLKMGIIGLILWLVIFIEGFVQPLFLFKENSFVRERIQRWTISMLPLFIIGSFTGTLMTTQGMVLSGIIIGMNWRWIEYRARLQYEKRPADILPKRGAEQ